MNLRALNRPEVFFPSGEKASNECRKGQVRGSSSRTATSCERARAPSFALTLVESPPRPQTSGNINTREKGWLEFTTAVGIA